MSASGHRLFIAGCGYVGRALVRLRLQSPDKAHHFITGTAGSTESVAKLGKLGIDARQLDLDRDTGLELPGGDWSLLYMIPPARSGDTDQRLARLLARLDDSPPNRMVYLSTSGVYGDRQGALTREDDPVAPATPRARRRADAEQQVRAFCQQHDIDWVILRVPGIYGPGRLRLEAIAAGEPLLAEADCGPGNRIQREDLAHCCQQALLTPASRRVYNVCDDEHASSTTFALEVARQAGLPPPPQIPLTEAKAQFSETRLSFLLEARRLDNRAMHASLEARLRYPQMREGIAASLALADADEQG